VPPGESALLLPMSKTAHKYLYESVNKIFKAVPELGGMINITHARGYDMPECGFLNI